MPDQLVTNGEEVESVNAEGVNSVTNGKEVESVNAEGVNSNTPTGEKQNSSDPTSLIQMGKNLEKMLESATPEKKMGAEDYLKEKSRLEQEKKEAKEPSKIAELDAKIEDLVKKALKLGEGTNIPQAHINGEGFKANTPEGWWPNGDQALAKDVSGMTTADSIREHKNYEAFRLRIQAFKDMATENDFELVKSEGEIDQLFFDIIETLKQSYESKDYNDAKDAAQDGMIDFQSEAWTRVMTEFDNIIGQLDRLSNKQFTEAHVFGFWSKMPGKLMAEEHTDLCLETSGFGGIFDGMPSLVGEKMVDWNFWTALSQAYAKKMHKELEKIKILSVFVGAATKVGEENIFKQVEFPALLGGKADDKDASGYKKILENKITYYAVMQEHTESKKPLYNEFKLGKGYHASSHNNQEVQKLGQEYFEKLPSKEESDELNKTNRQPSKDDKDQYRFRHFVYNGLQWLSSGAV